jgi:hypothetical protein
MFSGIRIIQAYCKEQRQAEKFASVAGKRVEAEISAEKGHILVHSLYHHFWQLAQILGTSHRRLACYQRKTYCRRICGI